MRRRRYCDVYDNESYEQGRIYECGQDGDRERCKGEWVGESGHWRRFGWLEVGASTCRSLKGKDCYEQLWIVVNIFLSVLVPSEGYFNCFCSAGSAR